MCIASACPNITANLECSPINHCCPYRDAIVVLVVGFLSIRSQSRVFPGDVSTCNTWFSEKKHTRLSKVTCCVFRRRMLSLNTGSRILFLCIGKETTLAGPSVLFCKCIASVHVDSNIVPTAIICVPFMIKYVQPLCKLPVTSSPSCTTKYISLPIPLMTRSWIGLGNLFAPQTESLDFCADYCSIWKWRKVDVRNGGVLVELNLRMLLSRSRGNVWGLNKENCTKPTKRKDRKRSSNSLKRLDSKETGK